MSDPATPGGAQFQTPSPNPAQWNYTVQQNGRSLATFPGDVNIAGAVTYDVVTLNRIIEQVTVTSAPAAWSGGRRSWNIINQTVNGVTVDAGAGFWIGTETSTFIQSLDGGAIAAYDFLAPIAANTNLHNQFYVARNFVTFAAFNMGGTGTSFALAKGDWFPSGAIGILNAGATNTRSMGSEDDSIVHVGASVAMLYVRNLVGMNAVRGAVLDFAQGVSGASQGDAIHIGWNNWLLGHDRNGLNPFHAGTKLISFDWSVAGAAMTVKSGFDALGDDASHRLFFSDYFLRSQGFSVDGSGNQIAKNAWQVFATSNVQVDNTGSVTENVLVRVTIPGGRIGPNGVLRIWPLWSLTNNANNKTERCYIGPAGGAIGTLTLVDQVILTASSSYERLLQIMNVNDQAVQKFPSVGNAGTGLGAGAAGLSAGAVNTANDIDVVFTAQCANAADHLALESYVIEIFNK